MLLQPEFYIHIVTGNAGDAAPLLARIALHLGYNAELYPVNLLEITKTNQFARASNTCGFNEFFLIDFLRASVMEGLTPWRPDQVEKLKVFAHSPSIKDASKDRKLSS